MNKSELVAEIAERADLNRAQATAALDAVLSAIEETLGHGDAVNLVGFGNFTVAERAARKGRNPATGEEMDIPARKSVKFKPGKPLADRVNG